MLHEDIMNIFNVNKINNDVLIADILLRLKAIETLLVNKNIFTQEELNDQTSILTDQFTKGILQKADIQGDLDVIVQEIKESVKNKE